MGHGEAEASSRECSECSWLIERVAGDRSPYRRSDRTVLSFTPRYSELDSSVPRARDYQRLRVHPCTSLERGTVPR